MTQSQAQRVRKARIHGTKVTALIGTKRDGSPAPAIARNLVGTPEEKAAVIFNAHRTSPKSAALACAEQLRRGTKVRNVNRELARLGAHFTVESMAATVLEG